MKRKRKEKERERKKERKKKRQRKRKNKHNKRKKRQDKETGAFGKVFVLLLAPGSPPEKFAVILNLGNKPTD